MFPYVSVRHFSGPLCYKVFLDPQSESDPGCHAGSAGLFSFFDQSAVGIIEDDFARDLSQNFAREDETSALGWNLGVTGWIMRAILELHSCTIRKRQGKL